VHPGTLIADVGHLEEVLVETRLPDRFLKKRFVVRGEQEATTTRLR